MLGFTYQQLGGMVWNILLVAGGLCVAVTGPRYLHLIDKAFPEKSRSNPEAAAKQVRIFRVLGLLLALCGATLLILELTGTH